MPGNKVDGLFESVELKGKLIKTLYYHTTISTINMNF